MAGGNLQHQRFEYKYVINESIAAGIRSFVSGYLSLDPFGARQANCSYPVHSLYLDSDDLKLYHSTINGERNRYKLRMRFYENWPEAPVYFEIKRRNNAIITKERCAVTRDAAARVVDGLFPQEHEMVSQDPRNVNGLHQFMQLMTAINARPKTHVSYFREAWLQPGTNAVRVTMDRDVRSEPTFDVSLNTTFQNPVPVFGDAVILELKFTDRFPHWFRELVRVFGLQQGSAAKYVEGLYNMGPERLNRRRLMATGVPI